MMGKYIRQMHLEQQKEQMVINEWSSVDFSITKTRFLDRVLLMILLFAV
jgi:hypothetical protein